MRNCIYSTAGRRLAILALRPALQVCLVCLFFALASYGQIDRGLITGIVTDSSGAVVPGVSVRATNLATNAVVAAGSNASGNYTLNLLPSGEYRISAGKSGFKTFEQVGIIVHVNDRITLNIEL